MTTPLQNRAVWRWRLTRAFESIGRTGWIGLLALAVASVIAVSVLPKMNQQRQALEQDIQDLRQGRLPSRDRGTTELPNLLPGPAAATDFANLLHSLAAGDNVRIERMEYLMQRESGRALLLYRADVVAVAPYLRLRGWIDRVLRERPTVAIDDLGFERANTDAVEVTARLRLTLFMKAEP